MVSDRRLLAAALAAIAFLMAGPARAAVARPSPTAPAVGATVQFLPALAWTPVQGADKYEVQVSADAGMDSPVLGPGKDDFLTKNTRATLTQTVPNGTYYWRVRAIGADGSVSPWTPPRPFNKNWSLQPTIQKPTSGAALSFPLSPVVLSWTGVPGAAEYLVSVASDPALGSLVFKYQNQDDPNGPPNVAATSAAITAALAPGSYYWGVVPIDAEGNRGVATPVQPFSWVWPSATVPTVTDLSSAPEVYDPRLSWNPVPGAARYEVEVNSSVDFAPGSKVCCNGTMIATSVSPTTVLLDNTYYWRVRAIDPDGNAGVWNVGPSFTKTFDKGPPSGPVPDTSIKNLHMRDNLTDDTTTADANQDLSDGYSTRVPVVAWDPVPGASNYEVQVADWYARAPASGRRPTTSSRPRFPSGRPSALAHAQPGRLVGHSRRRRLQHAHARNVLRQGARRERPCSQQRRGLGRLHVPPERRHRLVPADRPRLQLERLPGPERRRTTHRAATSRALRATSAPTTTSCRRPGRSTGARRSSRGTPVAGAQSYFVVVAKDPSFGTIVDEAFTTIPAYAPRNQDGPTTYTDETTKYYWEVLPATTDHNGVGAPALSAGLGAPQDFQKQSLPPTLVYPSAVQVFPDQPRFQWTADRGRPPLPPPGRVRLELQQPARRHRHRLDRVHEQHDLSGEHGPLLARPRRRREQVRPHLVGDRNVPEDARQADAEPVEPDLGRDAPRLVVVAGSGRVVLRRLGRPPERQPP